MKLIRIEEPLIDESTQLKIRSLFDQCFPQYPSVRTYLKQLPNFRYLSFENEQLIGHLAVEYRMIRVSDEVCSIFGIVDFCIDEQYQLRRIGSQMLHELETLAKQCRIDFLVLQASEPAFYLHQGFQQADNLCRWLLIQEHQSIGLSQRRLPDSLMYKPLGNKTWENGLVDFLGSLF